MAVFRICVVLRVVAGSVRVWGEVDIVIESEVILGFGESM